MKKLMVLAAVALLASCGGYSPTPGLGSVTLSWPSGQSIIVWLDSSNAAFTFDAPLTTDSIYMDAGVHTLNICTSTTPISVTSAATTAGSPTVTNPNGFPTAITGETVVSPVFAAGTTVSSVNNSALPVPTMTLSANASASGASEWIFGYTPGASYSPTFTVTLGQSQTYSVP